MSSSPESLALGQALAFFGTVADYAAAAASGEGRRVAALALAMARIAGLSEDESDALFLAARLRNAGVLGNAAFAKTEPALSERERMAAAWDVPAEGARICEQIAGLPAMTADIVRWHAECWDGTGYPDQLRWSGIPRAAQLLRIAADYAASSDPEDALAAITAGSGTAYAPEQTRTFVMWYHSFGGEIEPLDASPSALAGGSTDAVLDLLSQRIDSHNGTPGRAARVAHYAEELGRALQFDRAQLSGVRLAALLFGAGELRAAQIEALQFDALARMGVQTRAGHAAEAAALLAEYPGLRNAAAAIGARAEWYDGSGGPAGLRGQEIPDAAGVLAVAIAYEALDQAYSTRIAQDRTLPIARIETAAGTQFDPSHVRAFADVLRARA